MMRRILLGFMGLHVLYHASKGPITGSFMMRELEKHGYKVSPGTVYPLLHRMEEEGLLTSRWEVVNGKRLRTYRITKKGRKILEEGRGKVEEICKEITGDGNG